MQFRRLAAAAALLAAPVASPLAADVTAAAPDGVAQALTDLGFRPELTLGDAENRTQIVMSVAGSNSAITFYGCDDNGAACTALLFAMGKDLANGAPMSAINEWNYNEVYGRAYLDNEDDPWIDMMLITGAGLSAELFETNVRRWESVVGKFDTKFK